MKTLPTLYTDYHQLLLDIQILGDIVSAPQQSMEDMKATLFEEFKRTHPFPTMEDERYKLSRQVSSNYQIAYNKELELAENESLIDFSKASSVQEPLPFDFSRPIASNMQVFFTYEAKSKKSDREKIIEKYDLYTGGIFEQGITQTENNFGSIQEDTSLDLSSEEVESLGTETPTVEVELDDEIDVSNLVFNTNEKVEETSEEVNNDVDDEVSEDIEDEEDSEDVDFSSDEDDIEDYSSEEDDSDDYSSEDSDVEDDSYEDYSSEEDSDDIEDYSSEDFNEEDSEDDYSSEDFNEEDSEDDYSSEDSDEEDSDDFSSEEDDSDDDFSDYSADDSSEDDSEDIVEVQPVVQVQENIEVKQNVPKVSLGQPKVDLNSTEDDDTMFTQEVHKEIKVPAPPIKKPVVQESEVTIEREEEPTDIRQFVRKHPRCDIAFARQYFTKKQIEDAIKIGKIVKKGNILKL